jgi:hypothetical protein
MVNRTEYPPPSPERPKANWAKTGQGSFTGIDYSQPGAADGMDPYLVWSDVGGFANLRRPGQPADDFSHIPTFLPILFQLADSARLADVTTPERAQTLFVEAAYLARKSAGARIVPAKATASFFVEFASGRLRGLVERIELDLPQDVAPKKEAPRRGSPSLAENDRPIRTATKNIAANARTDSGNPLLSSKVLAFIDDGCAFAHAHFRSGAGANLALRVKRLWDQNEQSAQSAHLPPAGFTNGRAFTDTDLKAMIGARTYNGAIDEAAVYADFAAGTRDRVNRLQRRSAHGTHVMDLACGPYFLADTMCTRPGEPAVNPSWERADDDAIKAPVIFVQLPMRTVQSTSGKGTLTGDVLDALQYISDQCETDAEIVVNVSWGTLAGPHDGTTILERAIDLEIAANPPGRIQVVIPAGNGLQSRTHARIALGPLETKTIDWRVPVDDATESYIELWMQSSDEVRVTVTLPNGAVLAPIVQGKVYKYVDTAQPFNDLYSIFGVNYADTPPLGQDGKCVLLAIAPTFSLFASRPVAPHGLWRIAIENVHNRPIEVIDAYIERDDVAIGTRRGARQSFFEDPAYRRHETEDLAPPPAAAYVFREGIFNGIGNGRRVVCVGGLRESDQSVAEYSPNGIYKLPARPNTKQEVDYFATSEESRTLHGVRAAGTRSGCVVRLSGTSDAAPQIARDLINGVL